MKISEVMSKMKSSIKAGNKKTKKFIPNLSATPNHICFKGYDEGCVYKGQIQVLNQDLKTYHIAIKFDNPDELKLSIVGSASKTRLDSGEDLLLEVEFRPNLCFRKESVDRRYEICLNIVNANTKLVIPVLILSPNPVVSFPKEISLPDTAVNTPAYSNIFVLNYSTQNCKFSFDSRNEIKIVPDSKTILLKASDGSSYLLEFIPKTIGSFRDKICVCSEGKKIPIIVKCNVIPINIFLNEDNIEFSPTFIGTTDCKTIHIINNSDEASFFEWIPIEQLHKPSNPDPTAKYVEIHPSSGEIQPNTITAINFSFKPEDTDSDEFDVLKETFFTFVMKLTVEVEYNPTINVRGKILGPTFQLETKLFDLGAIFLGENRYIDVKITNTGVINGKVLFQKTPSSFDGIIKVSSKSETLYPSETKTFKIKYLARKAGKFIEQVYFKVKNGERLAFAIQGGVKHLDIAVEPKLLEFWEIGMCVPEMKVITLKNKMPFDIDIEAEIENVGKDDPLEFLEFYRAIKCDPTQPSLFSTPSTSSSSSSRNSPSLESCSSLLTRSSVKNFMERTGKLEYLLDSVASAQEGILKLYSQLDDFLEKSEIVEKILQCVLDQNVNDEIEKRHVVEIILEILIDSIKSSKSMEFTPYYNKDWKIPENPQEAEIMPMTFKLQKNFDVKVFVTPNFVGKFSKNLKLKLRMSGGMTTCPKLSIDDTEITVPLVYDCQPLELLIHNRINSIVGFAESEILLEVLVENTANVDGFFYFARFEDYDVEIKSEREKFHMPAKSKICLELLVKPKKSGLLMKYINLVALGSNRKYPISIECRSLPPDMIIKPNKIFEDNLEVLKINETRIFIENRSPAKARFSVELEHECEAFEVHPRGGIMASKQCMMLTLRKFFRDPGDYRDIMVVEVVNSKPIKIPIKCTVQKLPIIVNPPFSNAIDFGTLFLSKTPYFLEYNFTNGGRNTYMVFVILKNWRNKCECPFTIEPNRFELTPGKTVKVTFYLDAEAPKNADEEITFEGCSIRYPIRELIYESRLRASVIKPNIDFSDTELVFECFYGDEESGGTRALTIFNKSTLPLSVALKIEGEFYVMNREQKVKFDLKSEESKVILIHFNRSLIRDFNAAQTFNGKIKAYTLGKLQSTLTLQAYLIYPTVDLSTREINFVNNLLPCTFTFTLTNSGKVNSTFKLIFDESSTMVTKIYERKQENLMNIVQCLMKQKCNLRQIFFMPDTAEKEAEIASGKDYVDGNILNGLHELSDISLGEEDKKSRKKLKGKAADGRETTSSRVATAVDDKDFNVEVSLGEVHKYFKNLTRALSEVLCNRETKFERRGANVSKSSIATSSDERSAAKLRLSQYEGQLSIGETRMISVWFGGGIEASHITKYIVCEVFGGSSQSIRINLTNCNPNVLITKTYFDVSEQNFDEITIKNLCVSNISPCHSQIKLITKTPSDDDLIQGYVKLNTKTEPVFVLDDQRNFCSDLKFSIFKGCCGFFKHEFGIQVNNNPPIPISFFGKNNLPNASILNFTQKALKDIDKSFEYDCLREMFKFVNKIRVPDEDVRVEDVLKIKMQMPGEPASEPSETKSRKKGAKREKKKDLVVEVDLAAGDCNGTQKDFGLFFDNSGSVVWREKQLKLYSAKMLHMIDENLDIEGYTALDYPEEYPEQIEIANFITQRGFVDSLKAQEIFSEFKEMYNQKVLEKFRRAKAGIGVRSSSEQMAQKCVVPLSLTLSHYKICFGEVSIDQRVEKVLQVFFHCNRVKAALRYDKTVPGLSVEFVKSLEIEEFYEIEKFDQEIENISLMYRNRFIRVKKQPESNLRRFHSFDFSKGSVHSRSVPLSAAERQTISQTYNELSSTKCRYERNPDVETEIYQTSDIEGAKMIEVKVSLEVTSKFFEESMEFDEIIYLDVHLGPQIPINIVAKIVHGAENVQ